MFQCMQLHAQDKIQLVLGISWVHMGHTKGCLKQLVMFLIYFYRLSLW